MQQGYLRLVLAEFSPVRVPEQAILWLVGWRRINLKEPGWLAT